MNLYYGETDFNDYDSIDEEGISAADWDRGYNCKVYAELSERQRWEVDHDFYDYDQAVRDEQLFDMDIIEPWRKYSAAKCDAEDDENFPSQQEWEELNDE